MWAWNEQQGVTLASSLHVDITSPGTYTLGVAASDRRQHPRGNGRRQPLRLECPRAGGNNSTRRHLVLPDRHPRRHRHGRRTFDSSDVLGSPTTTYPGTNQSLFGFEFEPAGGDSITMPDQRNGGDPLRAPAAPASTRSAVITKHDGAPTVERGRSVLRARRQRRCTLHGTADRPRADPLTISWSFVITTATAGTVCTPARREHADADAHVQRRRGRHRDAERLRPVPPAGPFDGADHGRQRRAGTRRA